MAMGAYWHGCGMRNLGRLAGLVCALAFAQSLGNVDAASKQAPLKPAKVEQIGSMEALNPALFKLVNGKSTLYFLGSLHLLPVGFSWHTPALDQAINSADVFVFEANLDNATAELHYFMDN